MAVDARNDDGAGGTPSDGAAAATTGGQDAANGGEGPANGGEAGHPAGLACEPDFGDCDESRLTGCETDLTWSVRHCGACGNDCDGACVSGRCEAATLVARLYAENMVASATTGFARVFDGRGNYSIVQIDMASGASQAIQAAVGGDVQLALGADRVYFFDPDTAEVRTTPLDGGSITLEQELVGVTDFGASPQGAYYVESLTDPDTFEDTQTLWFRATGSATWKKLRAAPQIEIHRSSVFGVVASEYDEQSLGHMFLLRGAEITELPEAPESFNEAVAVKDGVVVLTDVYDASPRLHWLSAESNVDYVIGSPSYADDRLIVLGDEVAILFESNGKADIRFFDRHGPTDLEIGIAPSSNFVYVDPTYLWYGVYDNWIEARFLRSQWFDLAP